MKPSWQTITVQQFIDLHELSQDATLEDIDRVERVIAIVYNLTPMQVESLLLPDFNRMAKDCAFFKEPYKHGKPKKHIKAGKYEFKVIYDVRQLRHRQYVEVMHFAKDVVRNMNLLMASVVKPVKHKFFVKENNGDDHKMIADILLEAKVCDIYDSCVFFCKKFAYSMRSIKDYLIVQMMMEQKMDRTQAIQTVNNLISGLDGYFLQKK